MDPMRQLMDELVKLPGIGTRAAERIVFDLMVRPKQEVAALADALSAFRRSTRFCNICSRLSADPVCGICADPDRLHGQVCVVEMPGDVQAIERSGAFRGGYHVLRGRLSPRAGVGPERLTVERLRQRVQGKLTPPVSVPDGRLSWLAAPAEEVILATSATAEGEATAQWIEKEMRKLNIRTTRIARGLPMGAEVAFAQRSTLAAAIRDRREGKSEK